MITLLEERWKMFSKLAFRNVRRSFRDYGVYLLTLTFGVCLFYTFNSLDGQGAMIYLAQSQNLWPPPSRRNRYLFRLCGGCAGLPDSVCQRFLLRRRKRELGTICCWAWARARCPACCFWRRGLSVSSPWPPV